MANYDVIGNIAIVKFPRGMSASGKKKFALRFLKEHASVRTVLEKSAKFSGRLRTLQTKWIAGEKTKEALYKENGCVFRFNVESCYFSPRLSTERLELARMVKKGERVLVMFGGVAPFAIVIAKAGKAKQVISVELGRECNKYAEQNVKLNKIPQVVLIQGDVRKRVPKILANAKKSSIFGASKTKSFEGFDRIVMSRPNLKDSFLDVAFPAVKKGGMIHYYGFYPEADRESMVEMIADSAKKAKRKIKIVRVKKAGDIGPYKFRYRVDVKVLN